MSTTDIAEAVSSFFSKYSSVLTNNLDSVRVGSQLTEIRLLLAISGGLDSVALAHLLASRELEAFSGNIPYRVIAFLHVNHGLRKASDADQLFVEELASKYQQTCVSLRLGSEVPSSNIEDWARGKRYDFFSSTLRQFSANFVLTAHHLDDQLETFFLRMLQARLNNTQSYIKEVDVNRKILRPLLGVRREQLVEYCEEHRLDWVEDETNSSPRFMRNRVRNQILPEIEKVFPAYRKTLLETSQFVARDSQALWEMAVGLKAETLSEQIKLDDAIVLRCLFLQMVSEVGESAKKVPFRNMELVLAKLREGQDRSFELDLGDGVCCRFDSRAPHKISFVGGARREDLKERVLAYQKWDVSISESELVRVPNMGRDVRWLFFIRSAEECAYLKDSSFSSVEITIDIGEIDKIRVGAQAPFGRIDLGVRGSKKLSKLYKEQKISQEKRANLVFIYTDSGILWVPGLAYRVEMEQDRGVPVSFFIGGEDLRIKVFELLGTVKPYKSVF